jgi:PDDEXK-like domain of unknown function (DUF3799)
MLQKAKKWTGKPVGMPGVYSDMPLEKYHAANSCIEPSVSSSGLRTIFTKSPKHYWATSPYNPKAIENEESAALILGRAAHHLVCGQKDFRLNYAVRPPTLGGEKWNGNRAACKVWVEDREREGRTVITQTQWEHIQGIAESLAADPAVQAGCLNGNIEQSFFWKDKTTGIWLKSRPDANPTDDLAFVDLKLTRSTNWSALQRTIREYGYFQQAALTATACEAIHGRPMDSFSFLFVENTPPYDIEFVMLKEADIVRGANANRLALDKFAECFKTKKWPGRRGDRAEPRWVEMREYDQKDIDYEISQNSEAR